MSKYELLTTTTTNKKKLRNRKRESNRGEEEEKKKNIGEKKMALAIKMKECNKRIRHICHVLFFVRYAMVLWAIWILFFFFLSFLICFMFKCSYVVIHSGIVHVTISATFRELFVLLTLWSRKQNDTNMYSIAFSITATTTTTSPLAKKLILMLGAHKKNIFIFLRPIKINREKKRKKKRNYTGIEQNMNEKIQNGKTDRIKMTIHY